MALPPVRIPNGNGHSRHSGENGGLPEARTYAQIPQVLDIPNLIESQIDSFNWFRNAGLTDVFREVSPISDYTEKKYELRFHEHKFGDPKYSPQECKEREITFSQPLYVTAHLLVKETGEIKEMPIFMGDFPMMTDNGTFVINGAERVVVSQLVRSPGIYFTTERNPSSNRGLCMAKLIPSRGAWLEFETSNKDILSVKVDRKRKVAAGTFLRALGLAYDDDILKLFADLDTDESHRYMEATLRSDPADSRESGMFPEDALRNLWGEEWLNGGQDFDKSAAHRVAAAQVEFYRRLRPGEPPSLDNSRNLIKNLFFEPRRYDLGEVGRHKLNGNLGRPSDYSTLRILTRDDIIAILRKMIQINQGQGQADDIDHLGNRRVRAVGELVQNQVRIGLLRMERMVKEKMTLVEQENASPQALVNIRPVVASVREFFGGSQLSQFMDQTNPLAELTHKRRLSALGPGGLSRERAGFDVRDVHFSHYGRICPIETPEGPNIGLLSSLASYARVNPFGFIESPYRVVRRELPKDSDDLRGRVVTEPVINPENDRIIVNKGVAIGANRINAIRHLPDGYIVWVRPFVEHQKIWDAQQIDKSRQYLNREIPRVREIAEREIQGIRETANREIPKLRKTANQEILKLRASVNREIQDLRVAANREIQDLRAAVANRIYRIQRGQPTSPGATTLTEISMHLVQHYINLGFSTRLVDEADIRAARNRLVLEHHPDRNPGDPDATAKTTAVNLAFEELSNPEKRKEYDAKIIDAENRLVGSRKTGPEEIHNINRQLTADIAAREGKLAADIAAREGKLAADIAAQENIITARENKLAADIAAREAKLTADIAALEAKKARLQFMEWLEPSYDPKDPVVWHSADKEEQCKIAQANANLDGMNHFTDDRVEIRIGDQYTQGSPAEVDLMDVSPMQIMSVSAALIPFLEHDDANRALMGSNMQRQAVPLLRAQAPTVGTGIEDRVARDSGQMVTAQSAGVVTSVNGREIVVTAADGQEHRHSLIKFSRTNQGTCFDQSPIVSRGDIVKKNAVLADSSSTQEGDLALGQNVLVAFMSWEGYNYEDAIILSERLYRDDYFTSIHIERHEMEARETKLGPEEITRDIPNVGENNLRDLDERGIIRIGADVGPGDILVGKVTPKGETELTAEEKLLRAIFGEKSRDVKDTSLRVPHGERGKVIDVKVLSRENKDDLSPGVKEAVRVWIAQTRKIAVGDKMAGRHGNKGVVARILPEEDMPYLEDGTPVDIILNPIGVPSRMNLGQVLETHLGWAARGLHFRANTPVFDGASDSRIEDGLARIWFNERKDAILTGEGLSQSEKAAVIRWLEDYRCDPPQMLERIFDESLTGFTREACLRLWLALDAGRDPWGLDVQQMHNMALEVHRQRGIAPPTFGKFKLYDGRTGDPFDQLVTVGDIYILKLIHLVEDKIHARSTGPYSMITQQPLGGKAQFGGQRFGEMEVWALEAYSAAYNLQEVLTVKSDDVAGRVKTYEAVVKGEPIDKPGVPESFNVLLKELQSLGLAVQLLNEENRPSVTQDIGPDLVAELGPDFGANLPDLNPAPEPAFAADD